MARESLAAALHRLGIQPMPTIDELKAMTEQERLDAVAASSLTAAQVAQLPGWWLARLRRRGRRPRPGPGD